MEDWENAWIVGERGIYLSADGLAWRFQGGAIFPVNALARQPQRLVAGVENGLWELPATARRWIQLHDETLTDVRGLAPIDGDPGLAVVSAYGLAVGRRDEMGAARRPHRSDRVGPDLARSAPPGQDLL